MLIKSVLVSNLIALNIIKHSYHSVSRVQMEIHGSGG